MHKKITVRRRRERESSLQKQKKNKKEKQIITKLLHCYKND